MRKVTIQSMQDVENNKNMSPTFTNMEDLVNSLNADDSTPNEELIQALEETNKIAKDPNAKTYADVDSMMDDILTRTGTYSDLFSK